MIQKVVIVGAGGHAQVIWDTWQALPQVDTEPIAWLDAPQNSSPVELLGLPVVADKPENLVTLLSQGVTGFYFGIGSTRAMPSRWGIYQRLCAAGLTPLTLIHPTAILAKNIDIPPGCYLGEGAVIQTFASLGEANIINATGVVGHHSRLGNNVHIAAGAILCGQTQIGANSFVGAGATLIENLVIGEEVTVGAGSLVLKNVADSQTVMGRPARAILGQDC